MQGLLHYFPSQIQKHCTIKVHFSKLYKRACTDSKRVTIVKESEYESTFVCKANKIYKYLPLLLQCSASNVNKKKYYNIEEIIMKRFVLKKSFIQWNPRLRYLN